jgi:hypothetical protein
VPEFVFTEIDLLPRKCDGKPAEETHRMGRDAHQGAIGLVIDRDYLEIGFPLETAGPKRKKKRR